MVGSTARPGVRRGDVSEEPRRWLLIAVLVAVRMPASTQTRCADDQRCLCTLVEKIDGDLDGEDSQVPSFECYDNDFPTLIVHSQWPSTSCIIQLGALRSPVAKYIEILAKGKIILIPWAFSDVGRELENLKLCCTLETIPDDAFGGLDQLRELHLSHNQLQTVNQRTFDHLPRLVVLYLDDNQLETIHDEAFDGLRKLKILRLVKNRLKTVSHTMFSHLSHLVALNLGHNQLETIPDDAFLGLGQLKFLVISSNRLTSLNATLVIHLSHLSALSLEDNPLACDCRLAWMQTMATNVTVSGVCTSPPTAKDQSITSYDVSQCDPDKPTNAGIDIVS